MSLDRSILDVLEGHPVGHQSCPGLSAEGKSRGGQGCGKWDPVGPGEDFGFFSSESFEQQSNSVMTCDLNGSFWLQSLMRRLQQ